MLLCSKGKMQSQGCTREDTGWVSATFVIVLGSRKQLKPQIDNISRVPSKWVEAKIVVSRPVRTSVSLQRSRTTKRKTVGSFSEGWKGVMVAHG